MLPLHGFAVHTRALDWRVLVGCVPFTLLIFVLILATNWPDREAEAQVGKRTLANRLAPPLLRRVYLGAMILGFGLQPLLAGAILPPVVVWSSFPALLVMAWAASRLTCVPPLPAVLALSVRMRRQTAAWVVSGS